MNIIGMFGYDYFPVTSWLHDGGGHYAILKLEVWTSTANTYCEWIILCSVLLICSIGNFGENMSLFWHSLLCMLTFEALKNIELVRDFHQNGFSKGKHSFWKQFWFKFKTKYFKLLTQIKTFQFVDLHWNILGQFNINLSPCPGALWEFGYLVSPFCMR